MSEREEQPSREQREWKKLAVTVRKAIAKKAEQLPNGNPAEILELVKAAQEALKLSTWAATFDHDIEHTKARNIYDND